MIDVLLIEDDAWLAEQFVRTLRNATFTVEQVSFAPTAMQKIDEHEPRVIILDMLLTGSTGMVLLHELQTHPDTAQIPVIVCTNLASTLEIEDLAPYGVRRLIDKMTMEPDDLVVAVRSVLL